MKITNLPKKVQYLENLSLPYITLFGKRYSTGRRGYGKALLFTYLLFQKIMNCSDRELEDVSGIDHTTFSKARLRFQREDIYHKYLLFLIRKAIAKGIVTSDMIAIDSSFVQTYSKRKEEGSSYWIKNTKKKGYGFKLHALVDVASGLPLAIIITKGSDHDAPLAIPLLRKFERYKLSCNYVLADKGYDSNEIIRYIAKGMKAKASIPMKKQGGRKAQKEVYPLTAKQKYSNWKLKAAGRTLKKSIYKKRTAIERFFAFLKGKFHLGKERMRGIDNFKQNCCLASICLCLEKLFFVNTTIF